VDIEAVACVHNLQYRFSTDNMGDWRRLWQWARLVDFSRQWREAWRSNI